MGSYLQTAQLDQFNIASVGTNLLISQVRISATREKLGVLKFSMEMRRGYPNALIISVKSVRTVSMHSDSLSD